MIITIEFYIFELVQVQISDLTNKDTVSAQQLERTLARQALPQGHIPDRQYPDGHLYDRQQPDRTVISPYSNRRPTNISPTRHTPNGTLARTDISPTPQQPNHFAQSPNILHIHVLNSEECEFIQLFNNSLSIDT